jgi:tRNA A64-2'-O-ribosylphosphate transferase
VCGNNNVVDCIIECIDPSCSRISDMGNNHIQLPILSSKFDRHSLENHLPVAVDFARKKLETCQSLLIFCADGEDISVCVCLAILLSCFDSTGMFISLKILYA